MDSTGNNHDEKINAIQVFKVGEGNKIILIKNEIEKILKNNATKQRKVCVISVAGIFRQGKSFLLNFFLHFLKKKIQGVEKWIDLQDKLVNGFSWKTTTERITEGMLMWPEIFLTKTEFNEEIAIVLIDTQGTCDHTTSGTQSASLFALSVLISSIQIYNVKNHLNTDHLKNLQVFTGYGSTHCETSIEKPFQKLIVLVRDWECPFEYHYGFEGGKTLLNNVFQKHSESKQEELTTIRETIEENFDQVDCFLMPHPGKKATTDKFFEGNFDSIDPEFLKSMETFVETVLAPENLVPKKINGQFISVEGLFDLIQLYGNHFKEGNQLNIKTIYTATADAYHHACLNKALEAYSGVLKQCDSFFKANEEKDKILSDFLKRISKMGTKEMIVRWQQRLRQTFQGEVEKHRTRLEENKLKTFCKNIFSVVTGGTTVGLAAVEAATVVTAAEVTTAGAVIEATIAGGIVGLGGGVILGGAIVVMTFGVGKSAIYVKNSEKPKQYLSHASKNLKNFCDSSWNSVVATLKKLRRPNVIIHEKRMVFDRDGPGVAISAEQLVVIAETNVGVNEITASGNNSKYIRNPTQTNEGYSREPKIATGNAEIDDNDDGICSSASSVIQSTKESIMVNEGNFQHVASLANLFGMIIFIAILELLTSLITTSDE